MGIAVIPPGQPVSAGGTPQAVGQVVLVPETPVSATAAANTQVQITVNGVAGQTIRLTHLSGSYSAAPTGGTLTVVVNGVTVYQADITAGGQFVIPLPDGGLQCQAGQNAVITLTAGGAAVVGRLNVTSHTR